MIPRKDSSHSHTDAHTHTHGKTSLEGGKPDPTSRTSGGDHVLVKLSSFSASLDEESSASMAATARIRVLERGATRRWEEGAEEASCGSRTSFLQELSKGSGTTGFSLRTSPGSSGWLVRTTRFLACKDLPVKIISGAQP